jgi:branched-subunit amino acid aminotransferase/4-amino-4-deoxychorismate lyase
LAIAAGDRGLTHGLGVFETLLAVDGEVRALELHLERMRKGAGVLGLNVARVDEGSFTAAIAALLERCGLEAGRARVRISVSAGSGDLRMLSPGADALLWITASRAADPPESVKLVTASFPRNEASPLAGIKAFSYAENLLALDEARRTGADEALFYNTRGELCEATTSNIFLVHSEKVLTPPLSSGCLPGTMRRRVLDFCKRSGIEAEEGPLTNADLAKADQAFITSAIRGVVPVSAIDGRKIDWSAAGIVSLLREAQ